MNKKITIIIAAVALLVTVFSIILFANNRKQDTIDAAKKDTNQTVQINTDTKTAENSNADKIRNDFNSVNDEDFSTDKLSDLENGL